MRIDERLTTAWKQLNLGGDAERDPGFRRIILRRTRGGMMVAATLAVVSVLLFVLSYLVRGRTLSFTLGSGESVVLWDELLVLIVSGLVFAFAQTRIGQGYGRTVIALMTVLIGLAILVEDAGNRDFSFTPGYLSLVLLVAVGTMPFRPAQTLALGATVTALYHFFTARFAPAFYDIQDGSDTSLTVYLIVLTAMLGGISGLLYYSRYQQYQALKTLARTQAQLIQSEKMASLGQLTAGIAHEIKNPLNFINNFAELNLEHVAELEKALTAHHDEMSADLRQSIRDSLDFIYINAGKIREQGQRVDAIVRAMMLHARGKPGERRATALNSFVDEYVNLAFYGVRVTRPGSLITIRRDYDDRVGSVEIVPQDLARVIINLLNNAFDAVHERALQLNGQNEGDGERSYEPVVAISTRRLPTEAIIRISDNGTGIPPEIRQKIFDPFFTTKPAGEGTGLGLSMSYDIIVHGHGGKIEANNANGGGAEFVIRLPATPLRYAVAS